MFPVPVVRFFISPIRLLGTHFLLIPCSVLSLTTEPKNTQVGSKTYCTSMSALVTPSSEPLSGLPQNGKTDTPISCE